MKTAASSRDLERLMIYLATLLGMTSFFNYSSVVYMISENQAFPDMCLFKVISLTKRKA
jgi:hypothetical protein